MTPPTVDVAATIVRSSDGKILLAERSPRQISGGYWELPGGKVDAGETTRAAAARELFEEVGIESPELTPWVSYEHAFPTKRVRLHFFRADRWHGTPYGREGQRIAWIDPARPAVAPILPSNERVLAGLGLPPLYAVADADGIGASELLPELSRAFADGIRLVELRATQMAPDQRIALACRAVALAKPFGARLLIAGSELEARRAGADGIAACPNEMYRTFARPRTPFWSIACRGAEDLHRASAIGADVAMLRLGSDSGDRAARRERLRALVASAPLPVYLGGDGTVRSDAEARALGAAGIALDLVDVRASRSSPSLALAEASRS